MPVVVSAIGQATLVAGTVLVNCPDVGPNDFIFLTPGVAGGAQGDLSVGALVAGVSFVINSTSNTDTSKVNWVVFTAQT